MAKERLPASHVVALAKNPLSASQLASVRNATGLASGAATFVAVRAKSNHQRSKHTRGSTYAGQTAPAATAGAARGILAAMQVPSLLGYQPGGKPHGRRHARAGRAFATLSRGNQPLVDGSKARAVELAKGGGGGPSRGAADGGQLR
jgi:hypothetical protein